MKKLTIVMLDRTGDASGAENDEGLESRSLWQDLQG